MNTTAIAKAIPAVSSTVSDSVLTVSFADGRSIKLDAATMSMSIRQQAMMHGFKQKVVDATALPKGSTVDDKYEAALTVYDNLCNEFWTAPRGEGNSGTLLLKALMSLDASKSKAEVAAFIENLSEDAEKALRKNARVAAAIESVRPKVDSTLAAFVDNMLTSFIES